MPQQYIAKYVLELWCDRPHKDAHSGHAIFLGRSFITCQQQAKKKGWKIYTVTKTATCPHCSKIVKVEYKRRRARS